jgi:hypothetical protein
VIEGTVDDGTRYLVLAPVRGLLSEVPLLIGRLESFAPGAVAVGLSPDEAASLREHFVGRSSEPLVPLAPSEVAEVRALAQFGDVGVPNPSYPAVIEWGESHGVPVEAVDPSDDRYALMFTDHISYTELVRRTLRERKLTRKPPSATSADEFALAWGQTLSKSGGSVRLALAREAVLAQGTRALGARYSRVAVVVERERFPGVMAALAPAAPSR